MAKIFSIDVVEAVSASVRDGLKLADGTLDRLREQAVRWDDPSADKEEERRWVRNNLTYIRTELERTAIPEEVVLTVEVENRCERQNSISQGFLIVGTGAGLEMRRRSDDARIGGYEIRSLEFYRKRASLDESERERVMRVINGGDDIVFRAVDIHGRTWDAYLQFGG